MEGHAQVGPVFQARGHLLVLMELPGQFPLEPGAAAGPIREVIEMGDARARAGPQAALDEIRVQLLGVQAPEPVSGLELDGRHHRGRQQARTPAVAAVFPPPPGRHSRPRPRFWLMTKYRLFLRQASTSAQMPLGPLGSSSQVTLPMPYRGLQSQHKVAQAQVRQGLHIGRAMGMPAHQQGNFSGGNRRAQQAGQEQAGQSFHG